VASLRVGRLHEGVWERLCSEHKYRPLLALPQGEPGSQKGFRGLDISMR
jgi:hypothetical protein